MADLAEAMIEREPLTILVTQGLDPGAQRPGRRPPGAVFKGDDALKSSFFAETTSKILVLASDGKVFTLEAAKLPGGQGRANRSG